MSRKQAPDEKARNPQTVRRASNRQSNEAGDLVTQASRNGGTGIGRIPTAIANWARGIAAWFAFVDRRRIDSRFPVFPDVLRIAEYAAIFVTVTALLMLYADPGYLASVQREDWSPRAFYEIITEFGRSDWLLYPAGFALIIYSLFRPGGMVSRSAHLAHTAMLAVYYLFTTVAFSGLITLVLKAVFGRARPEFASGIWDRSPFGDSYEFASFPSGHATTAGALATALALLFPRMRMLFLLAGLWTAISRPALGVHFPSDIFVGFCLGSAFSYYYARSFARKRLLFGFSKAGNVLPRFRLRGFRPVKK